MDEHSVSTLATVSREPAVASSSLLSLKPNSTPSYLRPQTSAHAPLFTHSQLGEARHYIPFCRHQSMSVRSSFVAPKHQTDARVVMVQVGYIPQCRTLRDLHSLRAFGPRLCKSCSILHLGM